MTDDDADALATLCRYGATVLTDAGELLAAQPPVSAQWYEDQAANCRILVTAFGARAELLRRNEQPGKDPS